MVAVFDAVVGDIVADDIVVVDDIAVGKEEEGGEQRWLVWGWERLGSCSRQAQGLLSMAGQHEQGPSVVWETSWWMALLPAFWLLQVMSAGAMELGESE